MIAGSASLPPFSTSFVGRDRELRELVEQITRNRFVGVTGPGGVGKTRLVAQAVEGLEPGFADGVLVVNLVGQSTPAQFLVLVADSIGVRDADAASFAALSEALGERSALLLLDGCELLDSDCLLAIQDLLEQCASIRILATSRRALHVDGGLVVALSPLQVPSIDFELPGNGATPDELVAYDAVELFVERARLVRQDFEITPANAVSVATLIRRLDGLPLAVELAASWVRALSVDQIVERMDTSANFPRAGTSNVAPRHRTLGSLVEGTFDLCAPEERLLWTRMTVFRDSFDLGAVEAVCGAEPLDRLDLLDTIASLVDQSVVVVDDISGHSRYRLLRLTREFAASRLVDQGDLDGRHHRHYTNQLTRQAAHWLGGSGQLRLLSQVRLDYANTIKAIEWGLERPETVRESVRMATDLWCFWFATGRLSEGRSVLSRVAAASLLDAGDAERIRALYLNAYLCVLQGEVRSARKLVDVAADSHLEDRSDVLTRGLRTQLDAMIRLGAGEDGTSLLHEAIAIFETGDDPRSRLGLMDTIGVAVLVAALHGDTARATALGARGLALSEESGDVIWRGYIEYALGVDAWLHRALGRTRSAALSTLRATPDELLATHCIELLAWCAASQDDFVEAARLFGAADRRWRRLGGYFSGFTGLVRYREKCLDDTRRGQAPRDFEDAYQSGLPLSVPDILEELGNSVPEARSGSQVSAPSPLTSREHEVALLVARGLSNRGIAEELTISRRTAESHVDHILTKLNLQNRTQVVAWVRRNE